MNEDLAYPIYCVPIETILPNPTNPRVIENEEYKKLVESVKQDGFMLAIRFLVVDANNVVMGGNQRLKACKEAGIKEIHIVRAEDLSSDQLKEFIIKDNLYFGEFDKEMLTAHYSDRELTEVGADLIDFESPSFEVIGDTSGEADISDIADRKQTYDNNDIKQIVTYFPAAIHEKVVESMEAIKKHMGCSETPEVLLNLIKYWKNNNEL